MGIRSWQVILIFLMLTGNHHLLNHSIPECMAEVGTNVHFLLNIATTHSLQQLVNFSTRQQNTLDLLFMTNPTLVDNVTAIPGISDHDSIAQIEFTTRTKINKKKPHKIYKFHQADFKQYKKKCVNSLNNISMKIRTRIPSMRTGIID